MIRISKSMLSFGAFILAAAVLTLAVPRTAHALAVALVQVANTPASPANTQDISKQASQMVQLVCPAASSGISNCSVDVSGGPQYIVKDGQSLVINTVEFIPQSAGECQIVFLDIAHGNPLQPWGFTGPNNVQFQYPSGIVLPAGTEPGFLDGNQNVLAIMNGYLTYN
jgi:hypothetical protein